MAFAFFALFPIVNPPAMAPIFLDMTSSLPAVQRHRLAHLIGWYSFIMLLVVLLVGGWVLKLLDISIHVIRIAGGLILFNTAWHMLNNEPRETPTEDEAFKADISSRAFFPMTMPITAGPGSIAITLTLIPTGPLLAVKTWIKFAGISVGIAATAFSVFIFFRYSEYFFMRMGKTGIQIFTKLAAFILLAIGVNIIWDGISGLVFPGR
jgi:multiple antibiotic resistance protein